jgi:8-amino-7-oxononanoate synthase
VNTFLGRIARQLQDLERCGIRRAPRRIEGPHGPRVIADGRSVLCFCANDYLGLAGHPALRQSVARALDAEGLGATGSRHVSGNMNLHRAAEQAFAHFTGQASALLFSTGYACNVGTIQALARRGDVIFSDRLNHASLIDGARLSGASIVVYEHADAEDLERKVQTHRGSADGALIVTESVFSMDGDVAPLRAIADIARRYDAGLVVDEAHAVGVFGPGGRGVCADLGVVPDAMTFALGKAFGSQGAFAAGAKPVVDLIQNRARSFVFSTAPWPAVGAAAMAALSLVVEADAARDKLRSHWTSLRSGLSSLGFQVIAGDSPIIPVVIGEPNAAMELSAALFERGLFIHGIRPPTVPAGTSRLRVVPSAGHSDEDIQEALATFAEVRP